MVYQTQSNALIAYKVQASLGAIESGSGGLVLRTAGGAGGRITKTPIESNEIRADGMRTRGRHGTRKTAGGYNHELSLGLMDPILEAVFRGAWSSANLALTEADITSITTTTTTIVAASGSWIALGLRVGDVIRLTGHASTGNNSRNLRIITLTADTITVAETLTLNATPDTAVTITRTGRKLINPAAGSLTKRYFTIEEYEADIDASEVYQDTVWQSLKFTMAPNGLMSVESAWTGTGKGVTASGGSAPTFTSPTEPVGVPLAVVDASVRLGSGEILDLTAFDLMLDIGSNAPEMVATPYSPDVFTGQMAVTMNLTLLRSDLSRVSAFLDETVQSLSILAVENESEPKDFVSIFIPNFTFGSVDKSALSKEAGPRTQTIAIPPALVGKDNTGGAYDPTMAKIQISNAT